MSASQADANPSVKNPTEALALALSCPICLQMYSEPVFLPCGHIYCHACIQTMGEGLDHHSCPECQADYQGKQAVVTSSKMCSIVESYKAAAAQAKPAKCYENDLCPVGEEWNTRGRLNISEQSSGSEEHESKPQTGLTKLKLASYATELAVQLEMAEDALKREKEQEAELTAANALQREKASKHLQQMNDLLQKYSVQVMQLMDEELSPGEASMKQRVSQASQLTMQLRHVLLRTQSLLAEEDETEFTEDLQDLHPHIVHMIGRPIGEEQDRVESKVNPARVVPKLEDMYSEIKERLGVIQRSLRNTLNPSEVTFDQTTAHPNLVLSEDLKTVTFSAKKQPYPPSPQRFTSFFQVLSSQSFSEGDHCWEVELDGAPWIIGLCYSGKLERSGISSALESSQGSWCLMWFNNLLTAFEQGRDVPLMRTTVSCRLEVRLSFSSHTLSFYNISSTGGKMLVHTCEVNLTEPVHLAYRMMSGHPKARVTIIS
ncbi:E3 ubiquitin-protein ligase TRIM68 [Dunckerocampus dactyliophorus]|uniref:E3 ubiquitin-protein ligase TRIM68 n=1 Tax=Dunckerocampus dactyliophorus TaxID=161453 RepID=UPI002405C3CA|nr:E3 ubiquitin-protein ligase TRIM68 [Dunckerocampus dactyliophorus]